MDSGILGALFRDSAINRAATGRPAVARGSLPETLTARVLSAKGETAHLRWQDGNFTASLSARVVPGETLLLKYGGVKKGQSHYRIVARLNPGQDSGPAGARELTEPLIFGMAPADDGGEAKSTALVRVLPRKGGKQAAGSVQDPLMELYLDTDNFGLILVRFYYQGDDSLQCRFVLESVQAGEALQQEADRLLVEASGEQALSGREPLQWTVGNLRRSALEALHKSGFSLDRQA